MRGVLPVAYFAATAVAAVGVSCWGTRVLLRQPDLPRLQRVAQLVFVWIVPFVGSLVILELYRPSRPRRFRASLNADEINPVVNQALQPLADGATRAATGFVEQEIFDAVVDHSGHDAGADGSH